MIINEMKERIDSLSSVEKDDVYRYLWAEYVRNDVSSHAEDIGEKLTDDEIEDAVTLYVYEGQYDCNISYWENIEALIERVINKREDEREEE